MTRKFVFLSADFFNVKLTTPCDGLDRLTDGLCRVVKSDIEGFVILDELVISSTASLFKLFSVLFFPFLEQNGEFAFIFGFCPGCDCDSDQCEVE